MYEKMQMVPNNTGNTWNFPFAAGLLSGCRDNQDIMDGGCRFDHPAGDFRPLYDEQDQRDL